MRVLRSYSIEEKVVSLVLVVVVFVLLFQTLVGLFRTPGIFDNEGGTYTEGLISETPILLNPVYVDFGEANREISGLIFSGLTKYNPDLQAFVGDLAELSISEDGQTYDFTLEEEWLDFIENDDLKTTMITMKSAHIMDEIQELSWTAILQNRLTVLMLLAENDRIVDNDKVQQFMGHMFS